MLPTVNVFLAHKRVTKVVETLFEKDAFWYLINLLDSKYPFFFPFHLKFSTSSYQNRDRIMIITAGCADVILMFLSVIHVCDGYSVLEQ